MAADGFWARRLTLMKTPTLTGPVKRGAIFFSTGCAQWRIGETVRLSEVFPDVCIGAAVHIEQRKFIPNVNGFTLAISRLSYDACALEQVFFAPNAS